MCCLLIWPFIFGGIFAVLSTWKAFKSKRYVRAWQICAILLWSSLLGLFVGEVGTTIDANGVLHEVGPILPLSAILFFTGIMSVVITLLLMIFRDKPK